MRILIASGIYPPDIGGPAQYARNLYLTWKEEGHDVKVAAYRWERAFPPIVRHFLYFLKVIRKGWSADLIVVLDTWSAAVPTMVACSLMHKKYIVRTGGDFLWESFVERTGEMVLFKDFYATRKSDRFTGRERIIFKLGGASLRHASAVIFSTEWQKGIFEKAYGLNQKKSFIVENFCGEREEFIEPEGRIFVGGTRSLKWKNNELLALAFKEAQTEVKRLGLAEIELDMGKAIYENFVERMRRSYAVILVSIGDISPNMILDAIRVGVPFILTKENGITHRVKDAAVFVDPLNKKEIVEKIVWMSDPKNRALQAEKVRKITYTHSWKHIGDEIISVWKKAN